MDTSIEQGKSPLRFISFEGMYLGLDEEILTLLSDYGMAKLGKSHSG